MRLITLFLLLSTCIAAAAQSTCDELVPQIMDASGINKALATSPEMMRQVTEAQLNKEGSMPLDAKRAFESVMLNGFDVERMTRNVQSRLMASCDKAAYSAALQQMQSPLGQKMLQLEMQPLSSPEEVKRMQRYLMSFPMQSPRESRLALIRRLMETTKVAESSTDQAVSISAASVQAISNVTPSKEQIADVRNDILPRLQELLEAKMYYTYRTATDEEMEQYIVMQASKPQQRFTQDEEKALIYAMTQEAVDLGVKLRKVALEQRAKGE